MMKDGSMRVALSVSIIVGIALILFLCVFVAKRAQKQRRERKALRERSTTLRDVLQDVEDEVVLQEDAGYSDVTAFRNILNNYPEALS